MRHIIGTQADSSLINGLGRYFGGPPSPLAVINVQQGKRYRMRLIAMSCDPNFTFSIDGHNFTVIEADGELTEPLVVDQLQILAGQRYSVVLVADKPVNNYWIRSLPNTILNHGFVGGVNSAILRYQGAPVADPLTISTAGRNPLVEANLHALINPGAPGIPGYGNADINLNLVVDNIFGTYYVNGVTFKPPTVPVLLQILSGAQDASQLLPQGSVIVLDANKVVELTMSTTGPVFPVRLIPSSDDYVADIYVALASDTSSWGKFTVSPITYLVGADSHQHSFDVVQSAGSTTFNYVNPVRRDVVSAGNPGQQMVIRWTTDNSGPWFLHWYVTFIQAFKKNTNPGTKSR
jgi:FtsP/CotA-like multicopper oxidase with cupredoxin domain